MKTIYIYKPVKFYAITFTITWACWFASAAFSSMEGMEALQGTFMGIGLLGPLVAALFMVFGSKSRELKRDFVNKLVSCKLVNPVYLPVILFLMPVVTVVSILLSTLVGQSIEQLKICSKLLHKHNTYDSSDKLALL